MAASPGRPESESVAETSLARSPPFLSFSLDTEGEQVILIGQYEIVLPSYASSNARALRQKLSHSLNLKCLGEYLAPAEFISILEDAYTAAGEYVYGHPLWDAIRGGARRPLYAYLLETRHYLAAASSRMSPAIRSGVGLDPLTMLISTHLIEEWDHAAFFREALEAMGCQGALVARARPLPSTLEWIHLTRHVASKEELTAAICSGFMEHSSTQREAVREWHEMLGSTGALPRTAVNAIFGHIQRDMEFEHSSNWIRAIHAHGGVSSKMASEILNDLSLIVEMIYRWQSSLLQGSSADIVFGMQLADASPTRRRFSEASDFDVAAFDGYPVLPASLLSNANWADTPKSMAAQTIRALAYAFGGRCDLRATHPDALAEVVEGHASRLHRCPAQADQKILTPGKLVELAKAWLCSIDGHPLWDAMLAECKDSLVAGYIVENAHYLGSAARHIAAAIGSCSDTEIRCSLIAHLRDELHHCEILRKEVSGYLSGEISVEMMRPLPTTVAFIGYLERLGTQNWRAYVLAGAFLQVSLSQCRVDQRHRLFYEQVTKRSSVAGQLMTAMAKHDEIDAALGHDVRPEKRLEALVRSGGISIGSIGEAAVVPLLAWSFLDGIYQHYRHGDAALYQRVGWSG